MTRERRALALITSPIPPITTTYFQLCYPSFLAQHQPYLPPFLSPLANHFPHAELAWHCRLPGLSYRANISIRSSAVRRAKTPRQGGQGQI